MKKFIAATYAPMHKNMRLNPGIIKEYSEFLTVNGLTGAFINGSTGDFTSLSIDERKQLMEAWAMYRPKGFYLINHVGHTNLREAKELAQHAAGMADAIAALAPYYFRPKTLDDLVFYCSEIAGSAPDIPFYYYHIPVLTGVDFLMVDFVEKAGKVIPNFAGIKYTKDHLIDFKACQSIDNERYELFFGIDEKFLDSLYEGATGWVGSTYNHLAPLYRQILAAFEEGNETLAREIQDKAIFFVDTLEALGGFHGGSKSFMGHFGLDMGPSRFPHKTFDKNKMDKALDLFGKEGLLELLSKPVCHGSAL